MAYQPTSLIFRITTGGVLRRELAAFARKLERDLTGNRPFGCLVTGDEELRRLNRDFRKKNYATDVLSFPSEEPSKFLGEIAISFPRAKEQAAEYGHDVGLEIEILMLHGVLHLLGMDHETDHGEMARAEGKWRARLGLPQGLIERVRQ